MKVTSKHEAWRKADEIFPTDYLKDERASLAAGYDIYWSTTEQYAWISDLGDRLELNIGAETVNIWIEEPKFAEYQIEDALKVISEAIYQIDDNIGTKLQKATGIDEARKNLYGAYAEIAKILKAQYPESKLFYAYNLEEA